MIPLVRPSLPPLKNFHTRMAAANASGKLANFGPIFDETVKALARASGRWELPVSNGTTALQLAVMSAFPPGSRILIPDFTHVGTLQAVVAAGCVPVLAPVDRRTWTLSESFAHCLGSSSYDGFIVVSPFGYRVDFEHYDHVAKIVGKPVVYDLAGAWGLPVHTRAPVSYSLHATKNFSCGEGGIVSFASEDCWEAARVISNFGTLPDRCVATPLANNMKVDEMKCAVIMEYMEQPEIIAARIQRKKDLIYGYQRNLEKHCVPHDLAQNAAPSLCVLGGLNAALLGAEAQRRGVEVKPYYVLLSDMPGLRDIRRAGVSSPFFRTCMALPSDVTTLEAETVVLTVLEVLGARVGH